MNYKKVKILSNVIIFIVITIICIVGFLPAKSIAISSSDSYNAIYNGSRDNNSVAIMINVYENTEVVEKMLDLFDEKGVKATFFVGGCWADDNQKTLKRIISSGHDLGNHGYFHKDHKKLSESENKLEIENCDKIVYSLTGYKMNLFAPPSGSFSKNTLKVSKSLNYKTIMWTKDTIDWRDSDENLIISRATKNVSSGDFILMHPKTHTLNALPKIIDTIKEKGLNLKGVNDCLGVNA